MLGGGGRKGGEKGGGGELGEGGGGPRGAERGGEGRKTQESGRAGAEKNTQKCWNFLSAKESRAKVQETLQRYVKLMGKHET